MPFFIAFFILLTFMNFPSKAEEVRVLAQPFAPFSIHGEKGKVDGFAVELFKLVKNAKTHHIDDNDHKIVPVTFKRMYTELQKAPRRVSVALGKNPQRLKKFKWVGPYVSINMGVIARKDKNIKISKIEDFNQYKIASISNAAAEQALKRRGVKKEQFHSTSKPELNVSKLASGRVDLMAHAVQSASYIIHKLGYAHSDFEKVYNINKLDLYFAFSKDFPDGEIAEFQTAMDQVIGSPAYQALIAKYHLQSFYKGS